MALYTAAALPLFTAAAARLATSSPYADAVRRTMQHRTGVCSLAETIEATRVVMSQRKYTESIRRSVRILQRDGDGFAFISTSRGTYWVAPGGETALAYDLGEQERNIYGAGKTGVWPGDIVLDCGANVGVYTREAIAQGARTVVAIEPAPENVKCLRRNFGPEIAAGRVIVYAKGVWDRDDVLTLHVDPKNSARDSLLPISGAVDVKVPLTTVDKLAAELRLPRVDFIKMDIEGAERHAIAGARRTISRFHPRMSLCVYHLPDDPMVIPNAVRAIYPGYHLACQCMHHEKDTEAEVAHFY